MILVRAGDLWQPERAEEVRALILQLLDSERDGLLAELAEVLEAEQDDDIRWSAALAVESLCQWSPEKVPAALLMRMARDNFFSVRSSAAVAYYDQAATSPADVPVELLGELASANEDWYVQTPAVAALLRLAQTRPAAVEVLARGLKSEDVDERREAARAFDRLRRVSPKSLGYDIAEQMSTDEDAHVRCVGDACLAALEARRSEGEIDDFSPF